MASKTAALAVSIAAGTVELNADLTPVERARGLVIFVHGSGSSRFSSRNRQVAAELNSEGFATLLADLLTPQEEAVDARTAELRFDIPMLARRTEMMIDWAGAYEPTSSLAIGLFGASTGAAAAVIAAANRPDQTRAVVSRGGRVDLAGPSLRRIQAPLLMIVGGLDHPLLDMHEKAIRLLTCPYRYEIIPSATHLFEEPGALRAVAQLAGNWFRTYLTA